MCESMIKFKSHNDSLHHKTGFERMYEMMEHQKFCDYDIVIGLESFPVHSVVMASFSDYFHDLEQTFSNEFRTKVVIINVTPEATKLVIEYCYTGNINLREDIVENIFNVSGFLQISSLLKVCGDYLKTIVNVQNCLRVMKLAKLYSNADLEDTAIDFIAFKFIEVCSSEEFLMIGFDELLDILKWDDLNISSETTLFRCVKRWVQHNFPNRKRHLCSLLEFIKLPLLPIEIIFDEVEPLLKGNCSSLVSDAIQWITIPNRRPQLDSHRNVPRKSGVVVLAIGDWNIDTSKIVILYDPETNTFSEFMKLNTEARNFRAVIVEDEIVVMAGFISDSQILINTVESYNIKTSSMKQLPPMKESRHHFVVAVVNGFIYAAGGYNGSKCLKTVERFDTTSQNWTYVSPLPKGRSDAGGAVIGNDFFIIGGGDCISNSSPLESYCYCCITGKWRTCAPTIEARQWPGVAAAGGFIYAVGGHRNELLSSAERYDPKSDTWSMIATIGVARYAIGVCGYGDNLIAYGGSAGTMMTELEIYNASTNIWTTKSNDSNVKRGHFNFIPVPKRWLKRIKSQK